MGTVSQALVSPQPCLTMSGGVILSVFHHGKYADVILNTVSRIFLVMYYSSNPSECFKPIAGLFYLIAQGFRSSVSTFFYALRSKCTDSGLLTVVHMVRQPCSSPHMLDSTRAYIWWQVRMVTSSTLRCLLLPRYFC